MAEKKKTENKAAKNTTSTKKAEPAKIDWSKVGSECVIIGKKSKHLEEGKEYTVAKQTAQLLVEKGVASLK